MSGNRKLCDDLHPSENCIVVEQCTEGTFVRKFHLHVADYRLSAVRRINLLHVLVIHFWMPDAETVVQCYLNRKWRTPPACPLPVETCDPEPGVVRLSCGSNTIAWVDQVAHPGEFRRASGLYDDS